MSKMTKEYEYDSPSGIITYIILFVVTILISNYFISNADYNVGTTMLVSIMFIVAVFITGSMLTFRIFYRT